MKISVVVLTKNEEESIQRCLQSLEFCDEVIVIDDNSIDKTRQISEKLGAKVFIRGLKNDFARQRNYGLTKANGEWVLFVDADEVISENLALEIQSKINSKSLNYPGYYLKRQDIIWNKKVSHAEYGNAKILRLALHKGAWKRKVHEYWEVKGNKGVLKNPLIHRPHQTIPEFIKDLNYYSTLHAISNKKEGKKSNLAKILLFPILKFTTNYFLKLGFFDGLRGFLLAIFMSFHSFLAWSKLWLLQKGYIKI